MAAIFACVWENREIKTGDQHITLFARRIFSMLLLSRGCRMVGV